LSLAGYLAERLLMSREDVGNLIDFGSVQVQGRQERNPSRRLKDGDEIRVYQPWQGVRRFYEVDPARILYQDRYILAYDKEAGVPSQQTPSDAYNNVFAALYRCLKESNPGPYVALHHRLDKDTSGIMLFAIHRSANRKLGDSFQKHRVIKEYLVWVEGRPSQEEWTANDDICRKDGRYAVCPRGQGKSAETRFELIRSAEGKSLLRALPLTGRTHQIRLHLAASGHPVLGDRIYGGKSADRLHLHAYRLRLPHPVTEAKLTFTAPPPPQWSFPDAF
jgi:23S rRNA pseudouridine1911/1915/1917 synthase